MLQERSLVETIAERIGPDSFHDSRLRSIFAALLETGQDTSMETMSASLDEDAIELMQELFQQTGAIVDAARTINDSITKLNVRAMEDRIAEVDRLFPLANEVERTQLEAERETLLSQKQASRKGSYKAFSLSRPRSKES